jgi:hypothetical protein
LGVRDPNAIIDVAIKNALKWNGQRAIDGQVFGVPAFVVDHEIFWGLDSTDMLIDHLSEPERFARHEFARVLDLPVAVRS